MDLFVWTDEHRVGIRAIDEQHQKLVSTVNDLFAAMRAGAGQDAMEGVFQTLVDYTQTHFATEEELMSAHGYPKYLSHKKEHEELTAKVLDLQRRFQEGDFGVTVRTAEFLRDWLDNHLLTTDQEYAPFLNAKGVH